LRHMGYAAALKRHGVRLEWLTLESDASDAFQERWGIRVEEVAMDGGLPVQRRREGLLREAFRRAASLPEGRRVVSTDSCGVSWNTAWQVWRGRAQGLPAVHNTSIMPGPMPRRWLAERARKAVCRLFFGGLEALVPQTREISRFFTGYLGMPEGRIRVIGNGVDCGRFAPADAERKRAARELLGVPGEAPVVVCVGSVVPRKGVDLLLSGWGEVLRRHPEARLVIAGTVGRRATFVREAGVAEDYSRTIRGLVEGLPDPASVVMSGRQVEDVRPYYEAADVFAFASEREGLPNAVLEAMASGLPALLARYEGFPREGEEFGREGEQYIGCERHASGISEGLCRLLADEGLRRRVGAAARRQMEATQDLPRIVEQWADLYRRAAAAPGRR
jgi:glycosyltransferase involved in cell wall biosynthesis